MVKVSIIMPVYNDEEFLNESISSVLNQTLSNIELICVNDGSTDNSLNILNDFASKYEFIKIFSKENEGSGIARNFGMTQAKGEYIASLDSDDLFIDNDALEKMYDVAIKNDALMVSANLKGKNLAGKLVINNVLPRYDEEKIITPKEYGIPWEYYKNIFKRDFLEENQIIFPDLIRGQDPVFLSKVLILIKEIPIVPIDFYAYRYPKRSSYFKMNNYEKRFAYIKHFKDVFDILDNADFKDISDVYEEKLYHFLDFSYNKYNNEIFEIVHDVFKEDKEILSKCDEILIKPKISIVVPILNNENTLNDSIKSILNQKFKEIEILCLNMNSSDNSADILDKFSKDDFRLRIFNQNDSNLSLAINNALKNVRGDYVYFLKPTDELSKNALEKLNENLDKTDSDIVLFKSVKSDDDGCVDNSYISYFDDFLEDSDIENIFSFEDIKTDILKSNFILGNQIFKKDFLDENNLGFNLNKEFEEKFFILKALTDAKKISYVPDIFYNYSFENRTFSNFSDLLEVLNIIEEFLYKKGYMDDLKEDFIFFKINQLIKYIFYFNSEEYFQLVKEEFLRLKNQTSYHMLNSLKREYYFILNSKTFTDYALKNLEDIKLENNALKKENKILNKKNNKLVGKNKILNEKNRKLKNKNKEIINSNSWKLTKPLRVFKKILEK